MADPIDSSVMRVSTMPFRSRIAEVRNSFESQKNIRAANSADGLEQVGRELESLFISYLLKEMRATISKSGFITGGRAEEIYTSMLDAQLAKELSTKGGIGLAALLHDQLAARPEKNDEIQKKK
jgi:Rod binding domain-containing protein